MTTKLTDEEVMAYKKKIDEVSKQTAKLLGATGITIIGFFPSADGKHHFMIDGGESPMAPADMYQILINMHNGKKPS